MLQEFKNEALVNFNDPAVKAQMEEALAKVKAEFGKHYPLVIGGEKITTEKKIVSYNPASKEEIVGRVSKCSRDLAEKAMEIAAETFESWKKVPAIERAGYLFKATAIMRRRKFEFMAYLVYEVGKNWVEADADVAEAIDFMDFYAREMIRLSQPQPLVPYPGEEPELYYIPLGVGLAIPPWNFALAIMVGITTSALVTGNTVLLKPSSESPVIAAKFIELLEEVGVPKGVVNFVPGSGAEIGDYLVEHPKTRFISFTGSMEVGIRINELAAKVNPGQIWLKRVIAEMGGKDSILVDGSADLDDAATGIVASAFGFQGQKCSACSRAIVTADVYDQLLEKVVEKASKITIGDPAIQSNYLGPVVSKSAFDSIMNYIEIGKKEGRLVLGGDAGSEEGYFINPTIIADIDPLAKISQEEIFGPVLAFIKAKDFNDAIAIGNNTIYGLTGAVYANDRTKLEKARREFHVGNLYLNRKCTGALVGVNPFGGFNMSGTDSKAGGRDYLLLFTQAKVVTEKY